jgi:LuxR family maltose regulon positive regulatory protein
MALPADEQTSALLADKTEGWPVGLRLLALSMRRQPTPGLSVADAFASNPYVTDYLLAEVLSSLPITVQDFLIKTSFLDRLFGPLCAAVTGMVDRMANGQPILEWLQRADIFLMPADDGQRYYRCHDLFRQFLRERLEQQSSPAEITALRLRASAWFAANGDLDEALHQALDSGDMTAAVQVVAEHRHELMNRSQWQRLERWVHLFPREVIDEQPDLLLSEIAVMVIRQLVGEMQVRLDRVETLLAQNPSERNEALWGEVEARRSALCYWSGDLAGSLSIGLPALPKIPANWWYLRAYTRLFLSLVYQVSGDLTQAYAIMYASGELDANRDYQKLLFGCVCFVHWITADLAGLARAARYVVITSDPSDMTEMVTWSRYHLGLNYYQCNELEAAEQLLRPLVTRPHSSDGHCFLNSAVLLARICQAQNRPGEARAIVDVLLSFALEVRSEAILNDARAFQAELALRQGRLAEAAQWAAQSGSFAPIPVPYAFVPSLVLPIVLLAQDTPASRQQARQYLTQMADFFTSIHYTAIRIQVLALQAMLDQAEGNESQALAALEQAIALAEPGGFLRLFVDLGPQLRPLLARLVQRGVSPGYLAAIGAAYGAVDSQSLAATPVSEPVRSPTRSAASDLIEPLTNRERDVLLLLEKRYSNKEIAATLSISVGTVRSHIQHTGDKLGVRGRRAIVQAAKDLGLLA